MVKEKYGYWIAGIVVAFVLNLIGGFFAPQPVNPNRQTITVNAPPRMQAAFNSTLEVLKLDNDYVLEFTEDNNANFVVTEGKNATGELFAYSPFIAIFNWDSDLKEQCVEKGYFVESKTDSGEYDLDFKKIINESISSQGSSFKIYYPSKESVYWDEFYDFLLFTVNDGYYPKNSSDMKTASETIEKFLDAKNTESIASSGLKRLNSISENSIYFMTYVELADLYSNNGFSRFRIMYPQTVVYHNYHASFDETGKILFDMLSQENSGFFESYNHTGYSMLNSKCYNTPYTSGVSRFYNTDYATGKRSTYNGVEIPEVTINPDTTAEEGAQK